MKSESERGEEFIKNLRAELLNSNRGISGRDDSPAPTVPKKKSRYHPPGHVEKEVVIPKGWDSWRLKAFIKDHQDFERITIEEQGKRSVYGSEECADRQGRSLCEQPKAE